MSVVLPELWRDAKNRNPKYVFEATNENYIIEKADSTGRWWVVKDPLKNGFFTEYLCKSGDVFFWDKCLEGDNAKLSNTAAEAYDALRETLKPKPFKLKMPDPVEILNQYLECVVVCKSLTRKFNSTRLATDQISVVHNVTGWELFDGDKCYSLANSNTAWEAVEAAVAWVNSAPEGYTFEALK